MNHSYHYLKALGFIQLAKRKADNPTILEKLIKDGLIVGNQAEVGRDMVMLDRLD